MALTWQDGTRLIFEPVPALAGRYALTRQENALGQALTLEWTPWRRLQNVRDASSGQVLLALNYDPTNGHLLWVQDVYNRRVYYSWSATPTPYVSSVSRIVPATTDGADASVAKSFAYVDFQGRPLLQAITQAHPNGDAATVTAQIFYDARGRVASLRDANGNTRTYLYATQTRQSDGETLTLSEIEVRNSQGVLQEKRGIWRDENGRLAGRSDSSRFDAHHLRRSQ